MKNLIFVDVEADGISPVKGTMAEFGAVIYDTRQTYHGKIWDSSPDPENPAKPILKNQVAPLYAVMLDFALWVEDNCKGRPIFVSDNPAYDWQWINGAFDECSMPNPFGHSARRISDFYAGTQKDFYNTQAWKRWRTTVHDHNPVNDAMGNVEAFEKILANIKKG